MRSGNPSPSCGGIFDWDKANARLKELNVLAEDPNLWNDTQKARAVMRESKLGPKEHHKERYGSTHDGSPT